VTLRLCIAGASGRMGRELIALGRMRSDLAIAAALDVPASPLIGQDAGASSGAALGVAVTDDVDSAIAACDVLIDFTRPQGTLRHLSAVAALGKRAVIGTTGFEAHEQQSLLAFADRVPMVVAPNMALGVNVLLKLAAVAARALHADFDIEVIEAHHRLKVDAPSGTALRIGEEMARAIGTSLSEVAVFSRHGITGERKPGSIGFATVRGGDLIGDHTALFAGTGERIEITHRSQSRATYVHGAFRAARFIQDKAPGCYGMAEVLGLDD
jgi:4-hydroxy-tetrahydrodipicolinate reductase